MALEAGGGRYYDGGFSDTVILCVDSRVRPSESVISEPNTTARARILWRTRKSGAGREGGLLEPELRVCAARVADAFRQGILHSGG